MAEVSVIIPTYNYGRFLPRAIDSVLAQKDVDVEVIVVDDGSTDDTSEILASYGTRIRAFRQENKGAPAARNLGLHEALGEFVIFLDADDWLLPGALSSRLSFLQRHPAYGWVYGPCIYHDEQGREANKCFATYPFAYRWKRQGWILEHLLSGELIHTCCVMMKNALARDTGGFRPDLPVLQDYEFWLRVAAAAPAGFIGTCNVVVMTHSASISRSSQDNYRTLLTILLDAQTRYPKVVQAMGWRWRRRLAAVMLQRAAHILASGDKLAGRALLRDSLVQNPWHWRAYIHLLRSFV